MTTEFFRLDRLDENPWNERPLDEANVATIAASLESDGLLQHPVGRIHPTDPGRVQLAYGHHRLAAFRRLAAADPANERWQLIPVDVRVIDDKQMARQAIIENHHRQDPSGIEKARALLRLTKEFGETQEAAGAVFGLTQSASSHLLRLLKLPVEVQALVDQRVIAERTARALVAFADWQPAEVTRIAQALAKLEPDERDPAVEVAIDDLLDKKATSLMPWRRPWPLEWPAKPMDTPEEFMGVKGVPDELPACKGCKFHVERRDTERIGNRGDNKAHYCLRKPCYDAKAQAYPLESATAAASQLGIPLAGVGEKVTVIWQGGYNDAQMKQMIKAVRAKRPELRLVVSPKGTNSSDSSLTQVTGTVFAFLAATNKAAIENWLDASKGKPAKIEKVANETQAQRERRINSERELAEERATERSAFNKARVDGAYLFDRAAHLVADNTVAAGGMLVYAAQHVSTLYAQVGELNDARRALDVAAQLPARLATDNQAKTTPALDHTRRKYIAYTELAKQVAAYNAPAKLFDKFPELVRDLAKCARDSFGVQLPAGWDTVPVHKTPANCWECGAFAGNPKGFTKAELAEGWGGDAKAGYHCPVHAPSKRLVNLFADKADSVTPAAHVRSHTESKLRPAPKPSAAGKPVGVSTGKPTRRAAQRAQAAASSKPAGKGGRK